MVASSARKIYAGVKLAPLKKVSVDQASWLLSMGEGFGKLQYRFVFNSVSVLFISSPCIGKLKQPLRERRYVSSQHMRNCPVTGNP